MTQPVVQQPVARPVYSHTRLVLIISVILFVLAAFAAGGHALLDIPAWSFGFGAFAAYVLAWVVP